MTNLPTNPTKTEIIEKYWFEFLQFLKYDQELPAEDFTTLMKEIGIEAMFWTWYMQKKLEPTDAR